jgi:DNA-binding MarR family transcriptional regulator
MSLRYQILMSNHTQTPDRIAELLVHVGRAARSEDRRSSLTAAQWTCLRFFARANGSTRTPSGFASFQTTTRGTASQIIKTLEGRGLISGRRSDHDRRSVRFDLTQTGRTTLREDPLRDLIGVIGKLSDDDRARFLETLSQTASALAGLRQAPAFGTCQDCSHFTPARESGHCACMATELAADEIDQLCASYHGASPGKPIEGDRDDRD